MRRPPSGQSLRGRALSRLCSVGSHSSDGTRFTLRFVPAVLQHYGTDNVLTNNIYYHVNIGDVVTPGRKEILMPDHCDASIRASTHHRDPATCHPDTAPTADCCCHPGCDQGKCSSFKFDRNIVYQPQSATGVFVGTTFSAGLDNFTFTDNLYWDGNTSTTAPMFNFTGSAAEGFSTWQAAGKDAGSILQDPQFVGEGKFTLKKSSPAIGKLGFQPIDLARLHRSLSTLCTI